MEKFEKIRVLKAFDPYLLIFKAYNSENFERGDRKRLLQNVCLVLGVTIVHGLLPIVVIVALGIWYIFDNDGAMKIVVVVIPPMLTTFQMLITFITLTAKNRAISETINRIQNVIDGSRCSRFLPFF